MENSFISALRIFVFCLRSARRLHDGATVIYAFRVSVSATKNGDATLRRDLHCVFSFDIFERNIKSPDSNPASVRYPHLQKMQRGLCLDSLAIPVSSLSPVSAFWVLDRYRLEDPQPLGGAVISARSGLSGGYSSASAAKPDIGGHRAGGSVSTRGAPQIQVNRLRNRLIAAFLAATVRSPGATVFIMTSLLERSLSYAPLKNSIVCRNPFMRLRSTTTSRLERT